MSGKDTEDNILGEAQRNWAKSQQQALLVDLIGYAQALNYLEITPENVDDPVRGVLDSLQKCSSPYATIHSQLPVSVQGTPEVRYIPWTMAYIPTKGINASIHVYMIDDNREKYLLVTGCSQGSLKERKYIRKDNSWQQIERLDFVADEGQTHELLFSDLVENTTLVMEGYEFFLIDTPDGEGKKSLPKAA